jgi:hypothetical protein
LIAAAAVALAGGGVITAAMATEQMPMGIDCSGYPQSRVWAEAQAWWTRAAGADPATSKDFGHVHVGACIPERETVSDNTTMKVRIILHNNPGTLKDMSVVYKGADTEVTVAKVAPPQRTCAGTCEMYLTVPIIPSKFEASGLQEVRFRVYVDEPDGNRMHSSLNWQLYVQNGKARQDVSRMPYLRGKGWYTGFGYCEPDVLSVPLPDRPVSGVWQPTVKQADHGSSDVDPSHHRVALDADAHAGIAGTPLSDGAGTLSATSLAIDTRLLMDGAHRLVQRVDCQKGDQVNSGVLIVQFYVDN